MLEFPSAEVQIGLVVTVLLQLGAFIWFLSRLNNRVSTIEERFAGSEPLVQRFIAVETEVRNLRSAVNGNLADMNRQLTRMDDKLNRLIERGYPDGKKGLET